MSIQFTDGVLLTQSRVLNYIKRAIILGLRPHRIKLGHQNPWPVKITDHGFRTRIKLTVRYIG